MKRIILLFAFAGFVLSGCRYKPDTPIEPNRRIVVFFSTKLLSNSSVKSTATPDEDIISKVILFGVSAQGSVVEKYPVVVNPSVYGIQLTVSGEVKSLYAIVNPSETLAAANPSTVVDLLALTEDFTNAPVSPFLMGGKAEVNGYNVNVELVRSVAKIVVSGADGFQVQSVEVKNTPAKGYVYAQTTLTVPSSSKVNYPENSNATVYVAENSKQNPITLTVKGMVNGKPSEVNIAFLIDGELVDILRNTAYSVVIGSQNQGTTDVNITITIREWDDEEIDKHYFD